MTKILKSGKLFLTAALGITLSACSTKYKLVETGQAKKIYNIRYGAHERNIMDVFLPAEHAKDSAFVLIIHGGAWKFGKKEHIASLQEFLFKNNFPTASMNYRLIREGITYRDQLRDVGKAVDFIAEKCADWHFNPDKIYIIGESAGGHLALLYGYANPHRVKKLVSLSGPADFYSEKYRKSKYYRLSHKTFEQVVGAQYSENVSDKFREASPVYNVSQVPTLLFQGNMDFLVNQNQGKALDSALSAKHVPHKFVFMNGLGHAPRIFNPYARKHLIYPEILSFLRQ